MTATARQIPEGYMEDAQGRFVPEGTVRDIDKMRDSFVREAVTNSKRMSTILAEFKTGLIGDIEAFIDLSLERYGVAMGGEKGNVTLTSYDGRYKLKRAIEEHLVFDEGLQAAKALIDECIIAWAPGARDEILVLVNDAFRVNQEGLINTRQVLGLRRLDIKDEKWQRAMQAISESVQVAGSKTYVRVYERQGDGSYKQIPLS